MTPKMASLVLISENTNEAMRVPRPISREINPRGDLLIDGGEGGCGVHLPKRLGEKT